MKLQCQSIQLRTTTPDDPELNSIREDEQIAKYLSETHRYTHPMPDKITFRIEEGEQLIGEVSLKNIRWYNRKAEITIYIIPTHQGKGIGKQALAGIMRYAFHSLNFYRLEAEVIEFNHRGIQLFQKFGFVEEGRLRSAKFYNGKYYDVIRFGLLRDEFESLSNQIVNP